MSYALHLPAFLLLLACAGCRDPGVDLSEDVGSSDMQVALTVNGGATETVVRASALALLPYSGRVVLTAGDRFVLHDDPTRTLSSDGTGYVATTAKNRGRVAVDLVRTIDRSIVDLGIDLPPPFTLEPVAKQVAWSAPIDLQWDRTEGNYTTTVVVEGTCAKKLVRTLVADTGAYRINGGEIERLAPRAPCTVTISVVRTAPWTSSRELFAQAMQARSVQVELLP